ncbi:MULTISPECIES: AraC family transcriptional regulator [Actinoalloteichus]|uniref:DNA-binding domain-containing protein, AraC-type n=1 Tax=Actinoalloteichus fjordicus TaxID=1612552 RepID=A0AAC9PSU0_9PSEU|nr:MULTISPECIES: AraC family transcriptional regulator [Actinoalloteichus]APU15380.1 DNA-binding domain-containing protein, AraC-type [Actinoalloteichus fjordicus]APU21447.1 DNA-binding domain-containing protein, AraC-type [Actinoalloteichus sp. GBA129-24]
MAERRVPSLTQAVIPPSVLSGTVEVGRREGRPIVPWFAGTGLDPTDLVTSGSVRVSYRQAAVVLRRAVHAMPGRPLGMRVGCRDTLLSFGMLGIAMRSCATAADALTLARELHQAAGSLMDLDVETFGDEMALRLHELRPDPELVAFLCEEALCSTLVVIRAMLGAAWSPTRVELAYPAPQYVQEYHRLFRCPLRFDAEANRLVFPTEVLARPLPTHHEPTRAVAVETCRRLLDLDDSRPDVVASVESLLRRNLRSRLTMTETARHLRITERTLRRRLTAAGEHFSTIRDRVRRHRAITLLRDSTLTIEAVAHEIGFSDAREFRRAYLRWTGETPSTTRRRQGQAHQAEAAELD